MKATTKQAAHYLNLYNRSTHTSVKDFYKKASFEKRKAETLILMQMRDNNGTGYKVLCGSCFTFTAAYRCGSNLVIELPTRQITIENAFEA